MFTPDKNATTLSPIELKRISNSWNGSTLGIRGFKPVRLWRDQEGLANNSGIKSTLPVNRETTKDFLVEVVGQNTEIRLNEQAARGSFIAAEILTFFDTP